MAIPLQSGKDYEPGDLIANFEPLVHCINNEFKSKFCDNCRKRSDQLKNCSKCYQMYYCDKECQQNDWKCHKFECKVMRNPLWRDKPLEDPPKLYMRWWLSYDGDPSFAATKHPTLNGTEICLNDINGKFEESLFNMSLIGRLFDSFRLYGLKIDRKKFVKWFGLTTKSGIFPVPNICYDVRQPIEETEQQIGLTVIFQLSLSNHSCVPNAHRFSKGFNMQLMANKPIAKGETITLGLIELQAKRAERQAEMLRKGMHLCQCLRCRLHLDKDLDYEEYGSFVRFFYETMKSADKSRNAINKEFIIDWQLILYKNYILGDYHPGSAHTLVRSFVYFAENSRYASKSLLRLWYKEIEPIVRKAFGSDHPFYNNFQTFASIYINI